jgi:hypothetical protein
VAIPTELPGPQSSDVLVIFLSSYRSIYSKRAILDCATVAFRERYFHTDVMFHFAQAVFLLQQRSCDDVKQPLSDKQVLCVTRLITRLASWMTVSSYF